MFDCETLFEIIKIVAFFLLLFSFWFAHLISIGLLLFAFLCWHNFCTESKIFSGNLKVSQKREHNEQKKNYCGIFSQKKNDGVYLFLFHCFPMVLCCLIKHHSVLLFHEFETAGKKREMILSENFFLLIGNFFVIKSFPVFFPAPSNS